MKKHYSNFLIILLCLFVQFSELRAESPQQKHDTIKRSYYRLKNIDANSKDLLAWEEVVQNYRNFISAGQEVNDKVLYEYASLLFELGSNTNNDKTLEEANLNFELVVSKYPHSTISDDALLKQAEILKRQGGSQEAIKELYQEIINKFPESDSAEIARARIKPKIGFGSPEKSSSTSNLLSNLPVVVIDPGHGGEDFGAENNSGLLEKDVVLSISLETERILNQRKTARAILTRRSDVFVPLPQRIAIANENSAKLFLSLHNNASHKHNQFGLTTYVLDNSSDEASKLLAERENKSAASTSDLDFIISDLIQSSKHPRSILLAESVDRSLISVLKPSWPQVKSLGIKKAPFYVLVGARMPCALVELFFLDHEHEGERLSDPQIRKSIALGLAKGIENFLAQSDE